MTELKDFMIERYGPDSWLDACRELGGARHWIPKRPFLLDRDGKIAAEFFKQLREGVPNVLAYRNLSEKYGLSSRQIRKIVNR